MDTTVIKSGEEFDTDSDSYSDSEFEYRHVQLPKAMMEHIPSRYFDRSDPDRPLLRLLLSKEWRSMGITQVRRVCPRPRRRLIVAEQRLETL